MKQQPIDTFTTKLGVARKVPRSRIWIEGKRLIAAGFTPGRYFAKDWNELSGQLTLTLLTDDAIVSTLPCKVSGKGEKPIIDITGQNVLDAFGKHCEHVQVRYYAGVILIDGAA